MEMWEMRGTKGKGWVSKVERITAVLPGAEESRGISGTKPPPNFHQLTDFPLLTLFYPPSQPT